MLSPVESRASPELKASFDSGVPSWKFSRANVVTFLVILAAIVYLGNAGFPGLLDDADSSHAMVSREMLQRHDWIILYMNGIRYLMKAPLHYWTVAASYAAFGQTEFSTRLPVALAMIGLVLLANAFSRRDRKSVV